MESFEEIRGNREYLFYTAVNQGFLQSAQTQSHTTLRRLKSSPNGIAADYVIPLAPGGASVPNHFGSRGQVRGVEAKELVEYYDSVNQNSIDSWLLDREGHKLWTKKDGFVIPSNETFTYEQFLQEINPPLSVIT